MSAASGERRKGERRAWNPKRASELRDGQFPDYVALGSVFRPRPAPWTGWEWQTDRRKAERRG